MSCARALQGTSSLLGTAQVLRTQPVTLKPLPLRNFHSSRRHGLGYWGGGSKPWYNMSKGRQGRREIGKASPDQAPVRMKPGGGCWREKSSKQVEQHLQTPAVGASLDVGVRGRAVRLEEGAEEADRKAPPRPAAQCSRMRSRTQSSLFHWRVLGQRATPTIGSSGG